jgi:hypothetical protein
VHPFTMEQVGGLSKMATRQLLNKFLGHEEENSLTDKKCTESKGKGHTDLS